jgi:hypothetical protein
LTTGAADRSSGKFGGRLGDRFERADGLSPEQQRDKGADRTTTMIVPKKIGGEPL